MRDTISDRLDKYCSPEPNSGCWIWTGAINTMGYGVLHASKNARLAHRLSYERHRGAIPEGLVLDHLCRNVLCINPYHLEAVTQKTNVRRGTISAMNTARSRAMTHCRKGHLLSDENVYMDHGFRKCRECGRARWREYYWKHRTESVA